MADQLANRSAGENHGYKYTSLPENLWVFRMCDFLQGLLAAFLGASIALLDVTSAQTSAGAASPDSNGYVGNQACAGCHSSIYDSYAKTSMARASGPALDNLIPADFVHQKSGVHYRIYAEGGKVWLSFERPNDPEVRGKRQLLYYIGSGRRGASYLFAVDGFLFESPVNWYADRHVWDMAPAYGDARQIPMNLPALTSCLHCHFSGMQPPIKGTENRYPMPPFSHSGVTCEGCHGPGAAHTKGGAIVNPAKLDPTRRDAVCMQCHLEGKAAIEPLGRHVYEFRPGLLLSDYIRHFVFADDQSPGLGAVGQFEALAQSVCKKKSGEAMSCTSCHDPHYEPSAGERVSYYRGKCLACHGVRFGTTHRAGQSDCTACHMPPSLSRDIAHTEVTDHRILRQPGVSPQFLQNANTEARLPRLIRFPNAQKTDEDERDLALAWVSLAGSGMTAAPETERLLRSAIKTSPNDPPLLSALGYSAQTKGDIEGAREFYEKALAIDPTLIEVATNLGVIEAKRGHLREAVRLWEDAFQRAPGQSRIGMNIARVLCEAGQPGGARDYVLRVLEFNPDLPEAKNVLQGLNGSAPKCEH
jgi:Tetratricopeptide repeat/Cytochrome c554 and c-prime